MFYFLVLFFQYFFHFHSLRLFIFIHLKLILSLKHFPFPCFPIQFCFFMSFFMNHFFLLLFIFFFTLVHFHLFFIPYLIFSLSVVSVRFVSFILPSFFHKDFIPFYFPFTFSSIQSFCLISSFDPLFFHLFLPLFIFIYFSTVTSLLFPFTLPLISFPSFFLLLLINITSFSFGLLVFFCTCAFLTSFVVFLF